MSQAVLLQDSPFARTAGQVATPQSPAANRPLLMIAAHDILERETRIDLLFWHAGNDRITVLDALLIDDPYPQAVARKSRRDSIRSGIDIVRYQRVHHNAAAGSQAGTDGVAGFDVKFIVE